MSGEFHTTLSSGFTEDLRTSWNFIYFADILRRLTEGQLSWLQQGIEGERKRRVQEHERLDIANAALAAKWEALAKLPPGAALPSSTSQDGEGDRFLEGQDEEALRQAEMDKVV